MRSDAKTIRRMRPMRALCAIACALVGLAGFAPPSAAEEIGVILVGNSDNFFRSLQRGIEKGAKDRGVRVLVRNPNKETILSGRPNLQLDIANDLVERKVSAIILAPEPLKDIAGSVSLPVPIILIDRDGPQFKALSTVSTDNFAAGRKAGLGLAATLPKGANVAVFRLAPNMPSTTQREEGFLSVAREKGWNVTGGGFVGFQHREVEAAIAGVLNDPSHHLDAMFAPNESIAAEAIRVVDGLPPGSRPRLVTFDWKPSFREALETGVLDFSVLQDPATMGYRGLALAAEAGSGHAILPREVIDTVLVTRKNIGDDKVRAIIAGYEDP